MEPAASIVAQLGIERVAQITGRDTTSVYRWMRSADKGGTDGEIPSKPRKRLREYVRQHGIPWPAESVPETTVETTA